MPDLRGWLEESLVPRHTAGMRLCRRSAMHPSRGHRIGLMLEKWLVDRQLPRGGFQGRANKLADGSYSFWQGGTAGILEHLLSEKSQHEQLLSSSPSDTAPPQGIPSSSCAGQLQIRRRQRRLMLLVVLGFLRRWLVRLRKMRLTTTGCLTRRRCSGTP